MRRMFGKGRTCKGSRIFYGNMTPTEGTTVRIVWQSKRGVREMVYFENEMTVAGKLGERYRIALGTGDDGYITV